MTGFWKSKERIFFLDGKKLPAWHGPSRAGVGGKGRGFMLTYISIFLLRWMDGRREIHETRLAKIFSSTLFLTCKPSQENLWRPKTGIGRQKKVFLPPLYLLVLLSFLWTPFANYAKLLFSLLCLALISPHPRFRTSDGAVFIYTPFFYVPPRVMTHLASGELS